MQNTIPQTIPELFEVLIYRFDLIDQRLDVLEGRFNTLEERFDRHEEQEERRFNAIKSKLEKLDSLAPKSLDHEERIGRLERFALTRGS